MFDRGINWVPGIALVGYNLSLIILLPIYLMQHTPTPALWATAVILYIVTGLAITSGYHRLYSHRTYKANRIVEWVLLWVGSLAAQGSAIRWAFNHRLHHAHVDTENDPHSIKKGFWYAHILWVFEKPRPIDPKVIPDLLADPLLRLQERYIMVFVVLANFTTCMLVGWLLGDFFGAFVIAGILRILTLHHSTWFINSLAHTWGWKPFCQEQSAVDNFVLSLITFGEGYHNFHHTFSHDYRNGIRWYHFDPTKWLIWTLSKLGLAHDLKKTDNLVVNRRLVLERKTLLLQRLDQIWIDGKEERERVQEISNRLLHHLQVLNDLRKHTLPHCSVVQQERQLQKDLRRDSRLWAKLSRNILHTTPSGVI